MHPNKSQKNWKSNSHLETNDRETACKGHIATDAGALTPGHNGHIQTCSTGNWNLMEISKSWAQKTMPWIFSDLKRSKYIEHPTVWDHRWTILFKNIFVMLEVAWKFEGRAGLKHYSTTGADINKTWMIRFFSMIWNDPKSTVCLKCRISNSSHLKIKIQKQLICQNKYGFNMASHFAPTKMV